MVREKTNATIIMEEDIEALLAEWDRVPTWIKIHLSSKHPAHRYEGQLVLEDECLFFEGRDMKEGKRFEMELPLDSITGVELGFSERMQMNIDPVFGTGGPAPFSVEFMANGQTRRAVISTCADNYPAHISMNNVRWYEMLDEILANRELHIIPVTRVRELVPA